MPFRHGVIIQQNSLCVSACLPAHPQFIRQISVSAFPGIFPAEAYIDAVKVARHRFFRPLPDRVRSASLRKQAPSSARLQAHCLSPGKVNILIIMIVPAQKHNQPDE